MNETSTPAYPVVCICGSMRFFDRMQHEAARLTSLGYVVLMPHVRVEGTGDDETKRRLDAMHLRKIDMADRILVVNVAGYIGDSTRREIEHAHKTGKPVIMLEPVHEAMPARPTAQGVMTARLSADQMALAKTHNERANLLSYVVKLEDAVDGLFAELAVEPSDSPVGLAVAKITDVRQTRPLPAQRVFDHRASISAEYDKHAKIVNDALAVMIAHARTRSEDVASSLEAVSKTVRNSSIR